MATITLNLDNPRQYVAGLRRGIAAFGSADRPLAGLLTALANQIDSQIVAPTEPTVTGAEVQLSNGDIFVRGADASWYNLNGAKTPRTWVQLTNFDSGLQVVFPGVAAS